MHRAYFKYAAPKYEFEIEGYAEMSANIIPVDKPLSIKLNWITKGHLNSVLCDYWFAKAFLEQLGVNEYDLQDAQIKVPFVPKPYEYKAEIVIPAYTVPEGVYELAITKTLVGKAGIPGPIVGSAKFECLQFYDPKKAIESQMIH